MALCCAMNDVPALSPTSEEAIPGADLEVAQGIAAVALDRAEVRQKMFALESALLEMPQAECPLEHLFAHGVYARQMTIPKGVMLTGAIHKTTHLNVVLKGDISVATETGARRIQAPAIFVSPPGTKRAGYAHEETVWVSIHGTHETDIQALEEQLVTNDYSAFLALTAAQPELLEVEK
jgi:hypothetical protein